MLQLNNASEYCRAHKYAYISFLSIYFRFGIEINHSKDAITYVLKFEWKLQCSSDETRIDTAKVGGGFVNFQKIIKKIEPAHVIMVLIT